MFRITDHALTLAFERAIFKAGLINSVPIFQNNGDTLVVQGNYMYLPLNLNTAEINIAPKKLEFEFRVDFPQGAIHIHFDNLDIFENQIEGLSNEFLKFRIIDAILKRIFSEVNVNLKYFYTDLEIDNNIVKRSELYSSFFVNTEDSLYKFRTQLLDNILHIYCVNASEDKEESIKSFLLALVSLSINYQRYIELLSKGEI